MNNSGDAAEQVVRLSLEGAEVALKLSGSAAKNIAAAIYAVMKNRPPKPSGTAFFTVPCAEKKNPLMAWSM